MNPVEGFTLDHPLALLALNVFGDQIGLPIPSYPSLMLAGAFTSERGSPDPLQVMVIALVACLLADGIWFLISLNYGASLSQRLCKASPRMATAMARGQKAYLRYGPVVLVFAKFLPGAGAISILLAGQMGMRRLPFFVYSSIGSVVWTASALALGAGLGEAILFIFEQLQLYLLALIAGVGAALAVFMIVKVIRTATHTTAGSDPLRVQH